MSAAVLAQFVEGLAQQLEALGHGEAPMVKHARAAAAAALQPQGVLPLNMARPGPAPVPDSVLAERLRVFLAPRTPFWEVQFAALDLEEMLGLRPPERIASARKEWAEHRDRFLATQAAEAKRQASYR